ncbi:MAG: FtsX-like permease family protein [Bdellovibrionota bacterium]
MIIKIALRNTIKNWRHSISALLSLSASFVSLVLFDGYMDDVKAMYIDNFTHRQMFGDIIIEHKDQYSKEGISSPWEFWISKEDQIYINQKVIAEPVKAEIVIRNLNFMGMITNGMQSQILLGRGYDPVEGEKMRGKNWSWNVTYGTPLDRQESAFTGALGQGLARKLACTWTKDPNVMTFYGGYAEVDKPFECMTKDLQISSTTVDGQLNAIDITAVALMDAGYKDVDDRYIQTSLEAAQTLMNTDKVSFISISTAGRSVDEVVDYLNTDVFKDKKYLLAQRWQTHRLGEMYTKTMDFLSIFRNFVVIVIVLVSTLSVLNTMVKLVKERTREIGTMRSIGFLPQQVVKMFFLESLFLSVMGTAVGAVMASALTFVFNSVKIMYKAGLLSEPVAFRIAFYPNAYVAAFVLLVSVGTVATYFATRQIIKSKIIDNLTYV